MSTDAKRARPSLYPTLYRVVWIAIWLCLPARAHTVSLTYAEVNVEENQILWTLRLPVAELDLLLNADKNHDGAIGEEEYRAAKQEIDAYIQPRDVRSFKDTIACDRERRRPVERAGWAYVPGISRPFFRPRGGRARPGDTLRHSS